MKFRLSDLIYTVIIALLLIAGVVSVVFSLYETDKSAVDDFEGKAAAQSEAEIDSECEETTEDETESLYMSEGYEVNGGDLYCSHRWQDWILTSPSTLTKAGNELRYCNGCGAFQNREFGLLHGSGEKAYIEGVKCFLQLPEFPNGCEVVALTTVLNYLGYDVTTDELIDQYLPIGVFGSEGDNPYYQYLGDPRGLGVGCYAPCIVTAANNYFSSIGKYGTAVDISGSGFDTYKKYVSNGIPVIFWGTTYMDCDPEIFATIYTDGGEVIWRNHSHCFVMIGYTDTTYIFCDPLRGIIEYPMEDVETSHRLVYEQACIIDG